MAKVSPPQNLPFTVTTARRNAFFSPSLSRLTPGSASSRCQLLLAVFASSFRRVFLHWMYSHSSIISPSKPWPSSCFCCMNLPYFTQSNESLFAPRPLDGHSSLNFCTASFKVSAFNFCSANAAMASSPCFAASLSAASTSLLQHAPHKQCVFLQSSPHTPQCILPFGTTIGIGGSSSSKRFSLSLKSSRSTGCEEASAAIAHTGPEPMTLCSESCPCPWSWQWR